MTVFSPVTGNAYLTGTPTSDVGAGGRSWTQIEGLNGLHLPTRKIVPRAGRHGTIEHYCARYMKYCCGAALVMGARLVIVPPVPAVTLFVVHTTGGFKLVVDNK